MKTGDWRRAKEIFEDVLDVPPAERPAVLDRLCGAEKALREAVEGLLDADGEPTMFSESAAEDLLLALEEEHSQPWKGRLLGAYRVLEKIGQGGMGTVFLAERSDSEFEKRVAIKVMPLWMTGGGSSRRFRRERQILALLEHSNIARLLDGGTTEEGQPYLVMEYVEGLPLTCFCDQERAGIRRRIELLREVCEAVSYAHQNLVVHRDLKSNNILVTAEGEPKLLDFGIAKLLDSSEALDEPGATATLDRRMTPEYASPEQLAGRPLTTATDVYSLGVLLYELLTGARPFSWRDRSLAEIQETLHRREPTLPSIAVARLASPGEDSSSASEVARLRRATPRQLERQLAGDLDNIVRKALRPEPGERYASVAALADDLGRYLEGLPVLARPAGWTYRAGKFLRRHALASAVAAVGASLVSGFAVVTYLQAAALKVERDAARFEQERSDQVVRLLLESFELADPAVHRGEQVTAREILDNSARRIPEELADQPELAATMSHTVGKVQVRLGLYDQARPLLQQALHQRIELFGADHPLVAESWHEWGSLLYHQDELEEAEEALRRAVELRRLLGLGTERARSQHRLADVRSALGDREDAVRLHREALATQERILGEAHPETVDGMNRLAHALRMHGFREEAEELYRRALGAQEELHSGDDLTTAGILMEIARLEEAKDVDQASETGYRALSMYGRLYEGRHWRVASGLNTVAGIERVRGNPEQALELYRQALDLQRELLGPGHRRLAPIYFNLAQVHHRDLGEAEIAEGYYRRAIEISRTTVGHEHVGMGFFQVGLGGALGELGKFAEAEAVLRQAFDLFSKLSRAGAEGRNAAMARCELGGVLLAAGRLQESEKHLLAGLPVLEETLGAEHRVTLRARRSLDELYRRTGRPELASGSSE